MLYIVIKQYTEINIDFKYFTTDNWQATSRLYTSLYIAAPWGWAMVGSQNMWECLCN
jgi:NH3-dependent NAD+ synthetase